jgi:hypothetical protein
LLVITGPSGLEDFFLEYDRRANGPHDPTALDAAARVGGLDFVGPPLALSDPSTSARSGGTDTTRDDPRVEADAGVDQE